METQLGGLLINIYCVIVIFLENFTVINSGNAEEEVALLMTDFLLWRSTDSPEYAARLQMEEQAVAGVQQFTEEAFVQRKNNASLFLERARAIDTDGLPEKDRISVEVIKDMTDTVIRGFKFRKYSMYNPVNVIGNPLSDWRRVLSKWPWKTVKGYNQLLDKYKPLPAQVDQVISLMRHSIKGGITQHADGILPLVESLQMEVTDDPTRSSFFTPFLNIPEVIPEQERFMLIQRAKLLIERFVSPSWLKFLHFLSRDYLPQTRPEIGISSLPGGREFYEEVMRWHLSIDTTPEYIHQLGLNEVNRIHGLLIQEMQKEKFSGDLRSCVNHIKKTPENIYTTLDEFQDGCQAVVDIAETKVPDVIGNIPSIGVHVRGFHGEHGPGGFYTDPSSDGTQPGVFYVNSAFPKPKTTMVALSLHEAVPGHHTQSAYAIETGLPDIRRIQEYRMYGAIPFHWPFYTAYVEGWALYAEYLGEEMGIYTGPYAMLGRYSSEIFRAVRLVVDTGIHALGWSRERAIEYMKNNTVLPDGSIESEIKRYISTPGQALAYKIGEIKIKELRQISEDKLGSSFDKRKFHDQVLSLGPVPLHILENSINQWIDQQTKQTVVSIAVVYCANSLIIFISLCLLVCVRC